MNLTENTKVRIKVTKHLYESIQAELGKMEEAEGQQASVEEVAAAMDKAVAFAKKLAKQIADKKGGSLTQKDFSRLIDNFKYKVKSFGPFKRVSEPEEMNEGDYGHQDTMEEDAINEYVGMSPAEMQAMELAGQILAAVAAGTGLTAGIVSLAKKVKDKIKSKKSSEDAMAEPASEEMEEALDFETLMEAVKVASKKKAEDKKKKEVEAKKKKEAEDKKKKEVEAKKKAAAAKKK
jgi:hypothetical protein